VLVLAGVFGFLVYKRATKPAELIAQTGETTDDGETSDDAPDAPGDDGSFGFDDDNSEPPQMAVSSSARPIPADDGADADDEVDDPFNTATATPARTASTAAPVAARLPTIIPADEEPEDEFEPPASTPSVAASSVPDLDANDPFGDVESETAAAETEPVATTVESQPLTTRTTSAQPVVDEEHASEPFSLEAPATTADNEAPELGFEAPDQSDEPEFAAKQPAIEVRTPATLPAEVEEQPLTADEAVSVQVRTKLPETTLDFGDEEEPQPLQPET
jgi:hypothetical protein